MQDPKIPEREARNENLFENSFEFFPNWNFPEFVLSYFIDKYLLITCKFKIRLQDRMYQSIDLMTVDSFLVDSELSPRSFQVLNTESCLWVRTDCDCYLLEGERFECRLLNSAQAAIYSNLTLALWH